MTPVILEKKLYIKTKHIVPVVIKKIIHSMFMVHGIPKKKLLGPRTSSLKNRKFWFRGSMKKQTLYNPRFWVVHVKSTIMAFRTLEQILYQI